MNFVTPPPSAGLVSTLAERIDIPLVVDLDGTLLRSDMLVETFSFTLARSPLAALAAVAELRHGRAALKQALARSADIDIARLPWNDPLVELITSERARGRRIYLASASDRRLVERIAAQLGLFDGIFASDGTVNLKGAAKSAALCAAFGVKGFIYAGNEDADFAIWETAAGVIVVNASAAVAGRALARWPQARIVTPRQASPRTYLKAIRVHQWLKNVLLVLPALAGHQVDLATLGNCILGFLSFSLCASSVYVANDLIDLNRDRAHPTKCRRPFAAGTIPVLHGLVMAPALLAGAILLAMILGPRFLLVLTVYYIATTAYSLVLKRRMMLDVVTLACLYGLRIVAGSVAVNVYLSSWLVAFSIFLFTSLALIKRCAELVDRRKIDPPGTSGLPGVSELAGISGRDYRTTDLPLLEAMAAASGFTSVLVFALYMKSVDVALLYAHPPRLWLIPVILIYWIGRVLMLTHRGEMHDDPVIFAATDRTSLACGAACVAVILASL